jgi:cobalt-precorrin 5A hydrolase / precorrin-3B C17-methyltransferase
MKNKIIFAGSGPGAPDLMTVRCLNAIKDSDVIIYAGSLISGEITNMFKEDCEAYDSAGMTLDEVINLIERKYDAGKNVLRLHSGDPSMYGTLIEQFNRLDLNNIEYEVIPGVSSVFASAAFLKTELTLPTVSQTLILTRDSGRTPVPSEETLEKLASHKATMAIFLSIQKIDDVIKKLIDGGYSKNTPIAVVYRASWPDEKIIKGTLSDISEKVKNENIKNQGMIIVGEVLDRKGELSGLYHAAFAHGFRKGDEKAVLPKYLEENENKYVKKENIDLNKTAIYSLTESGFHISNKISKDLENCHIFTSSKFKNKKNKSVNFFNSNELKITVENNWNNYNNHIFIMATGITVRIIAPLLKSKITDPAVVCCDDMENYAISLASGHIGGANRLVEKIAQYTEYKPVITTASDVRSLNSIDEFSTLHGWNIENTENIKFINSSLIDGNSVSLLCEDEAITAKLETHFPALSKCKDLKSCKTDFIVAVNIEESKTDKKVLWIKTD